MGGNGALAASDPGLLYRRVAAVLRARIAAGHHPPGGRLPTIAALAEAFTVAPATIRQALRVLVQEGLVASRQGSGSYVSPRVTTPAPPLALDLGWPALAGAIAGNLPHMLMADDAPPPLLPTEGLAAARYRHMRRVHHRLSGQPYALVDMCIDRRWFDRAPTRFEAEMALPLLEELGGAELPEMRQSFRLGSADADAARHLGVAPGAPVGCLRRALRDRDGVVAYWSDGVFRADAVVFEATLSRA
ncbi:GntR family transcriptional regulator [Humitalea sp. 24SJ18S-53]|uniref:GntR family transcriptional regulator n=1 Tax=Humitalea sp. 24SJ18S-53 TaxID=3422307 RepID=UPI003D67F6B5